MTFHEKKTTKDWFQIKHYPHLTPKLKFHDRNWVKNYVFDTEKVSKHKFFPLIHRQVLQRRYKRINGKRSHYDFIKNKTAAKVRHIYYATHLDVQIHSYYTKEILTPLFESALSLIPGIKDCVCAYRFIELKNNSEKGKSNIHFANEVFNYIRKQGDCIVMSFDIEEFFDSLNHQHLKKSWIQLLNPSAIHLAKFELPPDHYNIYKTLTNFHFVEEQDLLREHSLLHLNDDKSKLHKELKKIDSYCLDINQYRKNICGTKNKKGKTLINNHPFKYEKNNSYGFTENLRKGIPQGTAISSFLANLYLFEFDKYIYDLIKEIGLYRRYSDDIVVICPNDIQIATNIKNKILAEIKKYNLTINDSKTETSKFKFEGNILKCDSNLKYLGFEFDGSIARLKSTSLAKFYRKMKKFVKYKSYITAKFRDKNLTNESIHKKHIYKKYSHLGKHNYLQYAHRASKYINNNRIKAQIKKHWKNLNKYIIHYEKKLHILRRYQ